MAYNILSTAGSTTAPRRSLVNRFNAAHGQEFADVGGLFAKAYGRRIFPLRWVAGGTTAVTKTGIIVNSRMPLDEVFTEILRVLREALQRLKPKPTPPPGPPAPQPVPAEPVFWFRDEESNLFHKETHVGPNPAEFFAVRQDAVNAGLTADGACGA